MGNKLYENGSLKRILLDNGYIEGGIYYFYLRDHLGNNSVVAKADGQVVQRNHYFPYGKTIGNGESWGQAAQPYKFGGKEEETMFGLELYDFHARQMDRRIPGFLTVDPLAEKYYSISPYAYCAGNPVNAVDLNGDSITTTINTVINNTDGTTRVQTDTYYYGKDSNGNYGFLDGSSNLYSGTNAYVKSLTTALNDLRTGGSAGNALVSDLTNSTKNVEIANRKENKADPNGTYIFWNPALTNGGPDQKGSTTRPAYIGLGHEMGHIQDVWKGTYDGSTWETVTAIDGTPKKITNAEKYAIHIENQLRSEHGLPLRTHYSQGVNSTAVLQPGTSASLFYKRVVRIGNTSIPTTPYIY